MPRASRDPELTPGRLIEIHPAPATTRSGTVGRSRRAQRTTAARSRTILLPKWPAGDESVQATSNHIETRGALALLDEPDTLAAPVAVATRRHILVVEDDAHMAGLIRAGLELEGESDWHVQSADEGLRALELAGATPPDVVLLDVRLPGLGGAEVYHRLRTEDRTRHARILFLSAGTSYDLHQLGIEDGVLLRKPFDVRELVGLVQALLAG